MKRAIIFFVLITFGLLAGCSSSSSNGGSSPIVQSNMITIDNGGTVPILNNGTTTTVIYVHNNSTLQIDNIDYSATVNTPDTTDMTFVQTILALSGSYSSFINPASAKLCASLAPGASCPLEFTTPPLSDDTNQGSAVITASYKVGGVAASFHQIVNFQQIDDPLDGVNFASGVNISGFDHQNGYATVYLYAGGHNEIYNVDSLVSDKYAVQIINGNVSGQQMASGFVQAVEISSPIPKNNTVAATLSLTSSSTSNLRSNNSFLSTSTVGVQPSTNGAILVAGIVPVINTASTTSGSLTILNSGNTSATLSGTSATTGISNLSGCTSGTLAVGGTCTITFTVTSAPGTGTITVNYTGGGSSSVSQAINWYNSKNGALVSMSFSNPMSFLQSTTTVNTVTVTNIGGYPLTTLTVPTPQVLNGGHAQVTVTYPSTNPCSSSTATLAVGASCQYNLSIINSTAESNMQILFGFNGVYTNSSTTTQTYNRYAVLTYTTIALAPTFLYTPTPANQMTIQGNNTESTSQTLVVSNAGTSSGTVSSQGMESSYSYLFSTTNTCTSLAVNGTCNVTVKLNPYAASQTVSGTGVYYIQYSGGSSSTLSSTDNVPFTISPNQQSITMSQESAIGSSGGSGTSSSPYTFLGSTTSQVINLTFTNSGSNAINITGIQDSNSTISWQLNLQGSTCYTSNNLQPGATCTISYTNVLNLNTLAVTGLGSSYSEPLYVPVITFSDAVATGTQFQIQPTLPTGGTTVYATASLATIANTVESTTSDQVTVQSVLTNATNYQPITVTTTMEDYFETGHLSSVGNCSESAATAVRTQSCILQTSAATGSITYQVESSFITNQAVVLHTLFQMSTLSQIVSMNPIYISTTIPKN